MSEAKRDAKVYVASSWRNEWQPVVVEGLRAEGYEVYDFRNPGKGDRGFHWSEIDPEWRSWSPEEYRLHLSTHPLALAGFDKDMAALRAADAVVLVQPCGRSAHLEMGWAIGAGKIGIMLLTSGEPELMYAMARHVCVDLEEVVAALAAPPDRAMKVPCPFCSSNLACQYSALSSGDVVQCVACRLRFRVTFERIPEEGAPTVTDAPLDDSTAVDVDKAGYANE